MPAKKKASKKPAAPKKAAPARASKGLPEARLAAIEQKLAAILSLLEKSAPSPQQIGRASCRERV